MKTAVKILSREDLLFKRHFIQNPLNEILSTAYVVTHLASKTRYNLHFIV